MLRVILYTGRLCSSGILPHAGIVFLQVSSIKSPWKTLSLHCLHHIRIPKDNLATLYEPSHLGDHLPNLLLFVPRGNIVFQTSSPTCTTRNHLIYDEFFMTFSDNVTDSQLWVPSPKIVTFCPFCHNPAQNIVTFKQIRHEQHLKIIMFQREKQKNVLKKNLEKLFHNKGQRGVGL